SELHFLDLDDLLLGPGLVLALLFLVLELAVVHHPANRWNSLRRDLDQVELGLLGHAQGFPQMDDAERLVVDADQPDFLRDNLTVDAMRASRSDAAFSLA